MTLKLATLLLTTISAAFVFSTAAMAQDAPKHFSKRLEIPRAERLKNFSNNEDTPAIVSNRNKNRHERKRGRNTRQKQNVVQESESRTANATVNENDRTAAGRRKNAQQSRNRNNRNQDDARIIHDIAKGLLND